MEIINDKLLIGNVVADNLLEKYGSPLFVYDAAMIRGRYLKLRESIRYPKFQLYYSCKANSTLAIMQLLRKEGASVQVSSPAELYLAHKAGFSSFHIYHSGMHCSISDVAFCVDRNTRFGIDSLSLLKQYGEKYRGTSVTLRLNPMLEKTESGERGENDEDEKVKTFIPSKSGIPVSRLEETKKILSDYRLSVEGLHIHLCAGDGSGSLVLDFIHVMLEWAEAFPNVDFFNIGGGLGTRLDADLELDSLEHLSETIVKKLQQFTSRTSRTLTLAIEPGRYLMESAGYLIATVNSIQMEGDRCIAGLNTGSNHLPQFAAVSSSNKIMKTNGFEKDNREYVLSGNLNEESDVFFNHNGEPGSVQLPELSLGDKIVFCGVGAYAYSMGSAYCGRLLPAEVLVDGEKEKQIRKRQSFEDLVKNQLY